MSQTRDWKLDYAPDGRTVHIRPRNDRVWHDLDDDCVCGPQQIAPTDDNGLPAWIAVHQPLDGRRRVELRTLPSGRQRLCDGSHHHGDDDGPVPA